MEISFKSEKVKNKAKRFSEILEEDENLLTRLLKTPGSEKKKKNKLTESQKLETLGMCIVYTNNVFYYTVLKLENSLSHSVLLVSFKFQVNCTKMSP